MTMRLSLVIEGDGSGAKRALEQTAAAVEELGRKSEETGRKLDQVGSSIDWGGEEHHQKRIEELGLRTEKAREQVRALGEDSRQAATGVDEIAQAAQEVTPEIVKAGDAADTAGGKFSNLGSVIIGAAGGLAAGIAITAIGEGLKVAAGFAGDLFREITSNQPMIERALQNHAGLVGRIKGAWAEAEGAASSYGVTSIAQLRFESQQNVNRLEDATAAAQRDLFRGSDALRPSDVLGNPFGRFGPFKELVAELRQELRDGTADVIEFRQKVAEIAEDLPDESPFRGMAEEIFADTQAAAELQAELARSRDLLQGLKGDSEAAATALGGSADKYRELTDGASTAGEAIGGSNTQIRESGDAAAAAIPALTEYDRLLKSIGGGTAPELPSPARSAVTPILEGRGFASGGYTGHIPSDRVAGFVHGREYVFDAESTARIGVGNLDAIRAGVRGYATGGYVGVVLPPAGPIPPDRYSTGSGITADLAEEFRLLQGAVHQFGMVLRRTGDAGQALASVIQSVSQRFLDFSLRALDQLLLGGGGAGNPGGAFGLIGNLFGLGGGYGPNYFPPAPMPILSGGLYHGGGRVGPSPAVSRMVPSAVFVDAPRLHGGGWLKPGERPVIAMDGEEVGWPDQLARKYGGGTVINNFHVETPNPRAFAESRSTVARAAGRLAARSGRHS
jgi:hypothetical protein